MRSIEEKIIEAKNSYERSHGRKPDCVIIDETFESRLDPTILSGEGLLVFGMHLILVADIPHNVIRCGRMR